METFCGQSFKIEELMCEKTDRDESEMWKQGTAKLGRAEKMVEGCVSWTKRYAFGSWENSERGEGG